jgi:hypothetical protein
VYVLHASDGENFDNKKRKALATAQRIGYLSEPDG